MDFTKLKKDVRGKQRKIINWKEYNKSLKVRGSITFWISDDALKAWNSIKTENRKKGGQQKYSDHCIRLLYTLRLVFNIKLRQLQGFANSIINEIMKNNLEIPDYTTISRRFSALNLKFKNKVNKSTEQNIVIALDSTGLKVFGEKEWMNHKHGTKLRKIWRKLHIGVAEDGEILAGSLTTLRDSDIKEVPELLSQIKNEVSIILIDGGYSPKIVEECAHKLNNMKQANAIGPPKTGENCTLYKKRLIVESSFSRYKRIIGGKLKSHNFMAQQNEAMLSLEILNVMKSLGMPLYAKS